LAETLRARVFAQRCVAHNTHRRHIFSIDVHKNVNERKKAEIKGISKSIADLPKASKGQIHPARPEFNRAVPWIRNIPLPVHGHQWNEWTKT
jgi:hypothetical protein